MPLKRKLTTAFVALGLLGFLVIGVTSYTVVQWRESEDEQALHYTRSLRLQEARALTFEAFKEVPDAVTGGDVDARGDYTRRLAPIDAVFAEWAALAEDDAERRQVEQVQEAATRLDDAAQRVFDLIDAGDRDAAVAQLETVEETAFEPFDRLTTEAVESDRAKRDVVRADAADARRTATLALAVSSLGVASLLLLVGAFLAGGVFAPVRALHRAMEQLRDGRTDVRLPEQGDDEIAALNRDFNALAETLTSATAHRPDGSAPDPALDDARHVLSRLVTAARDDAAGLQGGGEGDPAAVAAVLARIDAVQVALDRIGSLALPVDLDLTPLDPMMLLHDVMDRIDDEVIRRSISTRIEVSPGLPALMADRARLRETLSELVRNALDALPERGGSIALRARPAEAGWVSLEVIDDGSGFTEEDVTWVYEGGHRPDDLRGVGLRLATSVVEQHGGRLQLESVDAGGTVARVLLHHDDLDGTAAGKTRSTSRGPRA